MIYDPAPHYVGPLEVGEVVDVLVEESDVVAAVDVTCQQIL